MLGSIMVASPESLLIDNEMCSAILRTVRGIEVREDLLDLDSIERVVCGEGHFLGEPQTLQLMKTEYVYPELSDRQSVADWLEGGGSQIWDRAQQRVASILSDTHPTHLSSTADAKIRDHFDIKLNPVNS